MRQVFLPALLLLLFSAAAQETELLLGFDGEFVAGRWNPLEFRSRDLNSDLTLTIKADQGDLRRGSIPAVTEWHLPGGAGLSVLEDDIFIPDWQNLSWTAATSERVVASGSFHPRELDDRPLAVLLSSAAGQHAQLLPSGVRAVPHPAADLPERVAAWDAVRLLVIDGTTAPPATAAVLAATVAGADVLLLEPLPASYVDLRSLVTGPVSHYGAGRILSGSAAELAEAAVSGDQPGRIPEAELAALNALEPARPLRLGVLLPFAAGYALVTVVLLRVAGLPGAAAALGLGLIGVFSGWSGLRPEPPASSSELEIRVSAGGLSRSVTGLTSVDRQGGRLDLSEQYRPLQPAPYSVTDGRSSFPQERWQLLAVAGRPVLREAPADTDLRAEDDSALLELLPAGTRLRTNGSLLDITPAGAAP